MRAVIWTDVFQCAVMFGGLLAVVVSVSIVIFIHCTQTIQDSGFNGITSDA